MLLTIKPLDAIFLRDSRPFEKGVETWANTIFPPYPSVFAGALRTAYFNENTKELYKAGLESDPTKNIDIGITCISKRKKLYFPLPLDMSVSSIKNKRDKEYRKCKLRQIEKNDMISSIDTEYYLKTISNYEMDDSGCIYIEESELKKYLLNKDSDFESYYLDMFDSDMDLIKMEYKIGIARSIKTKTAKESMLYRIGSLKLSDEMSFVINMNNLKIKESGLLKFGGKAVISKYNKIETDILKEVKDIKIEKKFKVYLITPAIFKNGWLPSWINKETYEGEIKTDKGNARVKLLTAAIGKYKSIGGFDMVKRKPKEMNRAVPAGSVYYFEIVKGDMEQIIEYFNFKKISEERANEGFGFSLVGRVNKND